MEQIKNVYNYDFASGYSSTISFIRFPLAVLVVATHSYIADLGFGDLHSKSISILILFEYIKLFFGKVLGNCPVPIFFFISGYLFFRDVKEKFTKDLYILKLKKRITSLLIPYLIWITIYLFFIILQKLIGVWVYNKSVMGIWEFIVDNNYHMYYDCLTFPGMTDWMGNDHIQTAPLLGPLWFVRDLMIMSILSPIIYWSIKTLHIFPLLTTICYITGFWPHGLSSTMNGALCFFCLGAYFSIHQIDFSFYLYRRRRVILPLAVIIAVFLTYHGSNVGDDWGGYVFAISIIIISAALLVVAFMASNHAYSYRIKNLSSSTMFIYSSHYFIVYHIYLLINILLSKIETTVGFQHIGFLSFLATITSTVFILYIFYCYLNKYHTKLCSILCGKSLVKS